MSGKTKLITYSIVGLAIMLLAFFLGVLPALRKVSELSQKELAARTEVMRLDQQILAYRTAQSDLSKATNKSTLFNSIVDEKNLYVPIEELEAAVSKTNSSHQLKILRDSLTDETTRRRQETDRVTDQSELEEIPYTMTAQNADYASLVNLFKYLENLPHYTEISEITLSYQEAGDDVGERLTAVINGVFLVKPK